MTRRMVRCLAVAALVLVSLPLGAGSASAEPTLQVTPNRNLDPDGHRVTVKGSGYDERKGIYVAWCVVPPKGQKPTPCGGGEDRDGSSGSSAWVSSFPPAYGTGLAEGYDEGGSFTVEINVARYIGDIDCFKVACAVTTRNDHERSEDRSQDHFAPVHFRGQPDTTATSRKPAGKRRAAAPPAPDGDTAAKAGKAPKNTATAPAKTSRSASQEGSGPRAAQAQAPASSPSSGTAASAAPPAPAAGVNDDAIDEHAAPLVASAASDDITAQGGATGVGEVFDDPNDDTAGDQSTLAVDAGTGGAGRAVGAVAGAAALAGGAAFVVRTLQERKG
ncbi:MAG TPA: hypothetical protein VM307_06870 [Egibacteraceae bacterium]|nr:hypothetical protein [Egibacteraceae bacterium]